MITDEQLQEWERIEKAATPGPWVYDETEDDNGLDPVAMLADGHSPCGVYAVNFRAPLDDQPFNGKFIAAARTALPDLIAEVRRLRAALKHYADRDNWAIARGSEGKDITLDFHLDEWRPWTIADEALK